MTPPMLLAAGDLEIEFFRQGDRFAHAIGVVSGGQRIRLLSSDEGLPDDVSPPSPTLQELHVEERPAGRRVALLVGMAGRSHWSASVEIDPELRQAVFDVACRMPGSDFPLGSRYRIEPGARIECSAESAELMPDLAANSGTPAVRLALQSAGLDRPVGLRHGAQWLQIEPARSEAAGVRTVRWKYTFFAPNSAHATDRQALRFGP